MKPNMDMDERVAQLEKQVEALRKERDYYRGQSDTLAGESVKQDYTISTLQNALRQKRQGFTLLSELQQSVVGQHALTDILSRVVHGITGTLGMHKAAALLVTERSGYLRVDQCSGFENGHELGGVLIEVPESLLKTQHFSVLVNKAAVPDSFSQQVTEALGLPYFVMSSIDAGGGNAGFIVAGRTVEQKPFAPALDSGDVDTLQAIAALVAAFIRNRQFAALQEDNEMLRHLATTDRLTGIPNRRYFEEVLHQEWNRAIRRSAPLSLFLLDVDHFKKFNDTYGHGVGDAVLKQVAERVTAGLRPGDVGARYGGEEFVVLLPETSSEGALAVAERVRQRIEATPMQHESTDDQSQVTVSIGVATVIPNKALEISQFISSADKALYAAKREGRNCVRLAG